MIRDQATGPAVFRSEAGREVMARTLVLSVAILVFGSAAYRPQLIEKTDHEPHTDIFALFDLAAPESGPSPPTSSLSRTRPRTRAAVSRIHIPIACCAPGTATTGQASTNASGCCNGYMRLNGPSGVHLRKFEMVRQ
jgi:hypothetical protein